MTGKKLQLNQWLINLDSGELQIIESQSKELYSTDLEEAVSPADIDRDSGNSDMRIDPQGIRLLIILAQHLNKVVSKDKLIHEIWQNTVVTDDALSRCVSRVRKVLKDNPRQPQLVETLPKRGYRLVATTIQWLEHGSDLTDRSSPEEINFKRQKINPPQDEIGHTQLKPTFIQQETIPTQQEAIGVVGDSDHNNSSSIVKPLDFVDAKSSSVFAGYSGRWSIIAVACFGLVFFAMAFSYFLPQGVYEPSTWERQDSQSYDTVDNASSLVREGDDYYAQVRRQDNEMAIKLYQKAMALKPESGAARAGLANALVQQVLRWSNSPKDGPTVQWFVSGH